MWFWHGRYSNFKGYSWKRTGQNGTEKDQDYKRMEDTNENQRSRKFPWICKLLQAIHPKFQPHSKAIKWVEREERMGMERRTPIDIWKT